MSKIDELVIMIIETTKFPATFDIVTSELDYCMIHEELEKKNDKRYIIYRSDKQISVDILNTSDITLPDSKINRAYDCLKVFKKQRVRADKKAALDYINNELSNYILKLGRLPHNVRPPNMSADQIYYLSAYLKRLGFNCEMTPSGLITIYDRKLDTKNVSSSTGSGE